jgi:phosphopantothenoylcysteine decarboxylase/phosphopantothenate--cysteine ligase
MSSLAGRTLALCVTGSVAAYKAAEVARLLLKEGARVLPVMTASGARFLGPTTLSGLTGEPVRMDMWDPGFAGEMHVWLARQADAVAVVPATADLLARLATGRADDLVSALVLCARGPVLAAPAMHPRMWEHPATQRNVERLRADGRVTLVGPVSGLVASGEEGMGRMAEPESIAAAIGAALSASGDLRGLRLLVSAGPTQEDLDPVRYLTNRSSGKMGFAIAERAAARGASVVLVAGPVHLPTPPGVRRVDVRSAVEMRAAILAEAGEGLGAVDGIVMTAAIADFRPAMVATGKIKKDSADLAVPLVKNPDVLAELGALRAGKRPVLVGFTMEPADDAGLARLGREKLERKRCDLVVANEAREAFGGDENRVVLVAAEGATPLPRATKRAVADAILDRVRSLSAASLAP